MSTRFFKPAATALATFTVIVLTLSLRPSHSTGSPSVQMIDSIIGAGSFNTVFPIQAGPDQQKQITARLAYLEDLLRTRDVRAWPADLRAERMRNIERLKKYRLRGVYPRNEADPSHPLPCFIDSHGAICAVGYLIEQSAGRDFAEWINRQYQYATVADMRLPALDAWIARSGLTAAEIRTIQEPGLHHVLLRNDADKLRDRSPDPGPSLRLSYADSLLRDSAQYGSRIASAPVRDTLPIAAKPLP